MIQDKYSFTVYIVLFIGWYFYILDLDIRVLRVAIGKKKGLKSIWASTWDFSACHMRAEEAQMSQHIWAVSPEKGCR